jgi:tetratricopeptide (TPR) repeat protein
VGAQSGVKPLDYFGAQATVVLRYARLLLVPYGFSIDPEIAVVSDWRAWLCWGLILGLIALAWRKTKDGWWIAAAFVLLAPSSTILPAADLAADRRLYLPMLAIAAWAGLKLQRVNPRILIAGAVLLAALSFQRSHVWSNPQALWTEAVERAPHKARPRIQLARVSDPQSALKLLDEAERIAPNDPKPPSEKAMRLIELGRPDLALAEFGRTLALSPRDPQAINNRGVALMMLGQRDAALSDFRRALQLDPRLADARANMRRLGATF